MNPTDQDERTIRAATGADLRTLQELARRTIDAKYRSFLGDEGVDAFLGSGASDAHVADGLARTDVLVVGDAVVGFCITEERLIDLMMVDHEKHRCGYGTMLLRYAEAKLFSRYDEIVLESFEANDQANAFYRKNRWRAAERLSEEGLGMGKIVFKKSRVD